MARLPRVVAPGYPHHVTQRGVRSLAVFHGDRDRRMYLSYLAEETDKHGVNILAWCLMDNHVHFIAVPREEGSLARAFGEAHRRYTLMKNTTSGVKGYLFQGRFFSTVLNERHLLTAVRYIELNPVRAAIVKEPWLYPWSSAAFHVGMSTRDPLVTDRHLLGLVDDWREFLATAPDESYEELRKATRTGRPSGDSAFVAEISRYVGRDLSKNRPGRRRNRGT
ncbi:MAG: transposase [Syntrophales bacterium]|nr:transposase [Syntrophales bacterium]